MSLSAKLKIALVACVSILAISVGILNLADRTRWSDPTDGCLWELSNLGLLAMQSAFPEDVSSVQPGDILLEINGTPVPSEKDYFEQLYSLPIGSTAQYKVRRGDQDPILLSIPIRRNPTFSPADFFQSILAFTYLIIGIFIGIRHFRSPGANHFFAVCLLSYILYLFTYTNKLSTLDLIAYWCSALSLLVLPAVFLHFCLNFPDRHPWLEKRPWLVYGCYIPFAVLSAIQILWSMGRMETLGLPLNARSNEWLDKSHIGHFAVLFLLAAFAVAHRFLNEHNHLRRQQLKWITLGTTCAIFPFFIGYIIPYLTGATPSAYQEASILCLILIPISFGYAIVRHKLMDVDILFKRGLTYALAVIISLTGYFALVIFGNRLLSKLLPDGGAVALAISALTIAFLFSPLRHMIQVLLDRAFYREKYDYRESLTDFSHALTREISIEKLTSQILERIKTTFETHAAALLTASTESSGLYHLLHNSGFNTIPPGWTLRWTLPETILLSGEETATSADRGEINREMGKLGVGLALPFSSRGKVVGVLLLGKPGRGAFYTSEDIELLESLGNYAAIALDNAALYHSLQREAEKMEQLRNFNENIIENIHVGILSADGNGRILACNNAMEQLLGIHRQELLGAELRAVFPQDVFRAMQVAGGSGTGIFQHRASLSNYFLNARNGHPVIVNMTLIPQFDPQGATIGSLLVLEEITEKVQLAKQLSQAEKLSSIGLLAAGVAHEVNTPIAGISSYTQMLLKQTPAEDPRTALLTKIEKQTFRASEIVNNLLNFSRMSEDKFEPVDINQILHDGLALLEHQLSKNGIEIQKTLVDPLPPAYGNRSRLQQVFVNLLLNARDAMPSGGSIHIRSSSEQGHICIDITDTGRGMPEEVLRHIYDPFYTTKEVGKGTGLGLAVSYGIIQEHSGRIFVESTPGEGTHFQVKLPVAAL